MSRSPDAAAVLAAAATATMPVNNFGPGGAGDFPGANMNMNPYQPVAAAPPMQQQASVSNTWHQALMEQAFVMPGNSPGVPGGPGVVPGVPGQLPGVSGGGRAKPRQPSSAAKTVKAAVLSPAGVSVLCLIGTFLVTFAALCAIQPPFTYSKPGPECPLEADKFSAARAAVSALIATAVATVILLIVFIVRRRQRKV